MALDPVLVQLGPIVVRWYSIMISLGVVAAIFLARYEARRRQQDPEHIWALLPWVLVPGILGARLGWVLVSLPAIQARGWEHALFTWEGGLSIQGAVIGGLLGALVYTRRAHLPFLTWADIVVPGVALAQAIGRWGNFFNQELFGAPCTEPWCIPISDAVLQRDAKYLQYVGTGTHFAPTFAYEMVWNLLNCALLLWLGRQQRWRLRPGDLLLIYALVYSVGRFFLEDVRLDSILVSGVKAPQVFALLTIVICAALLVWRHRPGAGEAAREPEANPEPGAIEAANLPPDSALPAAGAAPGIPPVPRESA